MLHFDTPRVDFQLGSAAFYPYPQPLVQTPPTKYEFIEVRKTEAQEIPIVEIAPVQFNPDWLAMYFEG